MNVKNLFTVFAILTLLLGLGWMIIPDKQATSLGLADGPGLIFMARRYAVLFLGNAVVLWLARKSPPSPALFAIVAGSFISTGLMALVSVFGCVLRVTNISGLIPVVIEVAGAICYGYLLFAKRQQIAGQDSPAK